MSFRSNRFLHLVALVALVCTGLACDKFKQGSAALSNSQVVATVGGHQITFGDWMKQLDLLRVFGTPVEPDNSQQVKAVLDTLIDQEVLLSAAQKANYTDPNFDEFLKNKLVQADIRLKEQKEHLQRDMEAINRMEKNYKDLYKKFLLAKSFEESQAKKVSISAAETRAWYDHYKARLEAMGQRAPSFSQLQDQQKKQVQFFAQDDKLQKDLHEKNQVDRKDDVIEKYLSSLSPSQQMLSEKGAADEEAASAPAAKKK